MREHITKHPLLESDGIGRLRVARTLARIFDYLFGVLYAVLLVRLLLDFATARRDSGFYEFILRISEPFYAPFEGIVPTQTVAGAHPVVWPLLVAIVAYMVLHALIRGVLRLIAHRS